MLMLHVTEMLKEAIHQQLNGTYSWMTSLVCKNKEVTDKEEVIKNKVLHKKLIKNEEHRMKLALVLTQLGILLNRNVLNALVKEIVTISNKFPEENTMRYNIWKG